MASMARMYRCFMRALPTMGLSSPRKWGPIAPHNNLWILEPLDTGSPLTRGRPRSGLLRILDALDQLGMLLAVFLPHRLHRFLERLLVVDLDDLDARRLDLLDRLLLHLVPKLALVLLRLLGELHDRSLVLLRQRAPDLLREHQDFRDHQVAGEGEVFGVTIVLPGGVGRRVVLGPVHDAGLHGVDQLVEA